MPADVQKLIAMLNELINQYGIAAVIFALQSAILSRPKMRKAGLHHTLDGAFDKARLL